ncbi:unnamed protein product [Arctia plantaginis]|uniref:Uncharacterized protein n=1 Tax=Arctia plantaginis TaxID=874455 RepID=A0A8S1ARK2_ARCPL|nr:unnamed protein product [Arctia plantaginis]
MSDKRNKSLTSGLPKFLSDCSADGSEDMIQEDDSVLNKNLEGFDIHRSKRIRSKSNEREEGDGEGFVTVNRRPKRLNRSLSKNDEHQGDTDISVIENNKKLQTCITA